MTAETASSRAPARWRTRQGARATGRRRVDAGERSRIVWAARQLVCEGGAERVTVGHVCAAAGISRSTFYAVFADRCECLLAVFDEAAVEAAAAMQLAYRPGDAWVDAVRGALLALLTFLDGRPGLARFLIVGSLAGEEQLPARRAELLDALARALEADCPAPDAESLPAPFGGAAVVGAVVSILHGRLLEDPVPSLVGLCGPLMGVIVLPYLDVAAARGELSRPLPSSSDADEWGSRGAAVAAGVPPRAGKPGI